MPAPLRSAVPAFIVTASSLMIALATGTAWIGRPLRLVQLFTLLGLGMMTGVSWAQAVSRIRQGRADGGIPAAGGR